MDTNLAESANLHAQVDNITKKLEKILEYCFTAHRTLEDAFHIVEYSPDAIKNVEEPSLTYITSKFRYIRALLEDLEGLSKHNLEFMQDIIVNPYLIEEVDNEEYQMCSDESYGKVLKK